MSFTFIGSNSIDAQSHLYDGLKNYFKNPILELDDTSLAFETYAIERPNKTARWDKYYSIYILKNHLTRKTSNSFYINNKTIEGNKAVSRIDILETGKTLRIKRNTTELMDVLAAINLLARVGNYPIAALEDVSTTPRDGVNVIILFLNEFKIINIPCISFTGILLNSPREQLITSVTHLWYPGEVLPIDNFLELANK